MTYHNVLRCNAHYEMSDKMPEALCMIIFWIKYDLGQKYYAPQVCLFMYTASVMFDYYCRDSELSIIGGIGF